VPVEKLSFLRDIVDTVPNPGTCDCVIPYGKRGFADVSEGL
jgi:hypothetical protein